MTSKESAAWAELARINALPLLPEGVSLEETLRLAVEATAERVTEKALVRARNAAAEASRETSGEYGVRVLILISGDWKWYQSNGKDFLGSRAEADKLAESCRKNFGRECRYDVQPYQWPLSEPADSPQPELANRVAEQMNAATKAAPDALKDELWLSAEESLRGEVVDSDEGDPDAVRFVRASVADARVAELEAKLSTVRVDSPLRVCTESCIVFS
jgi:hypothetical protein